MPGGQNTEHGRHNGEHCGQNSEAAPHLTVQPVERHRSVRQADHSHHRGSNVRQHSLVPGFPLLLLACEVPVLALGPVALSAKVGGGLYS